MYNVDKQLKVTFKLNSLCMEIPAREHRGNKAWTVSGGALMQTQMIT